MLRALRRRGTAAVASQHRLANRSIRPILADAEVDIERDAIIVDQSEDRILLAFIDPEGKEGMRIYPAAKECPMRCLT